MSINELNLMYLQSKEPGVSVAAVSLASYKVKSCPAMLHPQGEMVLRGPGSDGAAETWSREEVAMLGMCDPASHRAPVTVSG